MKIIHASAILTVQVPRLDPNQVKTVGLSTPRAQGIGPEAFGSGLANVAQNIGSELQKVANKELAEQDASRINKAQADYETAKGRFLHDPNEGILNTTGEAAIMPVEGKTLDQRAQEWRNKYVADTVASLGNQRQKDLFTKYAEKDAPTIDNVVMGHVTKQGKAVKLGNAQAATDSIADNAIMIGSNISTASPGEFEQQIMNLKEKVAVQSLLNGFGPESDYAKNLLSDKVSKVYATVVKNRISQDDDQGAIDFFEANKDKIKAELPQLEPLVNKVRVMKEGNDLAGAAWEELKPKTVNDTLNIEAMRKKLDGASSDVKAIGEKRIEELAGDYRKQKQLSEEGASNTIYGMPSKGSSYSQVMKAIDIDDSIDERSKEGLRSWADHKFKISEGRAEAKSDAKQAKQLKQLARLLKFQNEYTSGAYGTLTPSQVAKKTAELGPFVDNAMTYVDNVNKDLGKAKVTDSELTDTLRVLSQNKSLKNLIPNTDKPTLEDKGKMALLQGKVQELMAQSKSEPGKGMSVKEATLKALTAIKTDEKSWIFGSDTIEPFYVLGSDYESKYGKNPKKWPKASQDKYISELFYGNPANKGLKLDFKTTERYRTELVKGL